MKVTRFNPPVSKCEINMVENTIGFTFPISYKEIVSKYDKLKLESYLFKFIDIYNREEERDLNFLSRKKDNIENIFDEQHISNPEYYGIPNIVAFGICANGDYICFDYRDDILSNNPKIILLYHDDFVENDDGSSSMVVNFIANNFDEFIKSLY